MRAETGGSKVYARILHAGPVKFYYGAEFDVL